MKNRIIVGVFLLFLSIRFFAQGIDYLKEGISPQVALVNQYGSYPVDYSTGLVDISLPLYRLESGGLNIPLQLKFHASGLRSDERDGLLGLRWALFGIGHVSRIIKGYPDDLHYRYPFNEQVGNPYYLPDFQTLFGTTSTAYKSGGTYNPYFLSPPVHPDYPSAGAYKDTEYDIFSYTLPSGKSGRFILSGASGQETAQLMPYEPFNIYMSSQSNNYTGVTIEDDNGIRYCFGRSITGKKDNEYLDNNGNDFITTWHLRSVVSANKQDTILINYVKLNIPSRITSKYAVLSDELHGSSDFSYSSEGRLGYETSILYYMLGETLTKKYFEEDYSEIIMPCTPSSVSSIQVRSRGRQISRVDFSYEQQNNNPGYLKQIVVRNAQNVIVKQLYFFLKESPNGKIKLLDRIEMGISDNEKEIYAFDYYDEAGIPTYTTMSDNSDWWGFYSPGAGSLHASTIPMAIPVPGMSPGIRYINQWIPGGHKTPSETGMKMGMIKNIYYPTGGRTTFDYEINRSGGGTFGGLRIKSIRNAPASGKSEYTYYEYGTGSVPSYLYPPTNNVYGAYSENEMDFFTDYHPDYLHSESFGKYMRRVLSKTLPSRYTDFQSNPIMYNEVTEYVGSSPPATGGKVVYQYDNRLLSADYCISSSGNEFQGYRGYRYLHVNPGAFWSASKLISKTIYNESLKVKKIDYSYQDYRKRSVYDLPVYRYRLPVISVSSESERHKKELLMIYPNQTDKTFAFTHQEYIIGANRLVKETEYTYTDTETVTVTKEFTYDPDYYLPLRETITNSDGKTTVVSYSYPFSPGFRWLDPYEEMIAYNQLSPVIEKRVSTDGNALITTTNYSKFSNHGYYPSTVKRQKYGYNNKTLSTFHKYSSRGRPLYVTMENGENVVYLWSYMHQHPVAAIGNATYDKVTNALGGETFIIQLSDKIIPSDSDISAINNLRSLLPGSQVTTYTYQPLIGVLTSTDAMGITTYYDYDTMGRLKEIYTKKGTNKEILESYKYYYVNPQ